LQAADVRLSGVQPLNDIAEELLASSAAGTAEDQFKCDIEVLRHD